MTDRTVEIHRIVKSSPEKLFRAFTNPVAYSSWIPPYGFLCIVHHIEVKENGSFRMSFENFSTGKQHSWSGKFVEIKESKFIRYVETFDDPGLPGEMTTSIWINKVPVGSELKIIQTNIPTAIPTEMCYLGWQESIEKLIRLVEPEIKDN